MLLRGYDKSISKRMTDGVCWAKYSGDYQFQIPSSVIANALLTLFLVLLSFPFLHSVASLTNTRDWLTPTAFQLTLPFSNQDGCLGDEAPCSPFSPSPSYKLPPSGSTLPNVSLGAIGTGLNPQNFAARQVRRPLKFITARLWPRLGPGLQSIASFVCLGKFVDY